jgi:hypothetical protein
LAKASDTRKKPILKKEPHGRPPQMSLFEEAASARPSTTATPRVEPLKAPEPAVDLLLSDDKPAPTALAESARKAPRATAESMAQKQREISVAEFFTKNRHLLGFDNPSKALLTTIKEAVDNSLDACEEAGILPDLHVEVHDLALEASKKDAELTKGEGRFLVVVQDSGPGIVKAQVPKIFGKLLYGSKFHRLKQARGQQGIGISAAAMYGQLTTGKPIRVTSRVGKNKAAHVFDIQIDTRKNEPVVTHDETLGQWHQEHGTRVELEIVANWQQGQRFVNRYVEHTALANPHATIHYTRAGRRGPAHRSRRGRAGERDAHLPAGDERAAQGSGRDQAAPAWRRARRAHADGTRVEEPRRARFSAKRLQPGFGAVSERHPGQGGLGQEARAAARARGQSRDGGRASQGNRRHQAHEPAHELPEPDRRRAHEEGAGQLPERDRERGRGRRRERPARPSIPWV